MAAALIPLLATALPSVIQLIAGLVHPAAQAAESLGPGTGAVKFGQVFETVIALMQKAAAAGTIPKELPPDDTIKMIIQAVVSSMQLSGLLGGPVPPVATAPTGASPGGIILKAGDHLVISVAG